jgi:pantoate--beta-alanine ligase
VNPTQFNNPEDFKKYPTTIEKDIAILEGSDCDILFLPDVEEIYPDEASKNKHFDLGYLETVLEGKFRPGHFQGVCLVVEKLLNIINPDMLFIGQKDFQQCKVIKKLIDIMQKDIELVVCPTLREENGLAMSSRNLRLSETEKNLASELHQSLSSIKNNIGNAPFSELKRNAIAHLSEMGIKIEYLELANKNLEPITDSEGSDEEILLIAAFVNEVRLIDNLWINS